MQSSSMDDISRCRNQLSAFRIKELKDVLTRLGLPKQGKKQVLMDKILAVLASSEWQPYPVPKGVKSELRSQHKNSKEEIAKVIDDIYRKLRGTGAVELASGRSVGTVTPALGRSDEQDDTEIQCVCGSFADHGTMIQCENRSCGVWQHLNCVVVPETEGADPGIPSSFYCGSCRISSGDPFCVTLSQPLPPVKLFVSSTLKMEGTHNPLHCVEKTFSLTKADRDNLHKTNHDLQVWCLLLNDKVPYRMHWPAYADLRVNGVPVRVITRAGQQLLGINGRDDGPSIFSLTREGSNKVFLTGYDSRPFCIGIRMIRRRTIEQVMSMVPGVSKGEPFEEALARVKRCINGSCGDAADDSDSDLEVVAESVTVNLSCPISGSRINMAGRFRPCGHLGGFDMRTFVELNQKTRKWQCPVCMKNYTIDHLVIDPVFNRIAQMMKGFNEDVKEVELKADGLWRPKLEGEARFKEPWRNLEGSLVVANGFHKPAPCPVKTEQNSPERVSLKIGIKRTRDGQWAINRLNKDGSGNSNNVAKPGVAQERSFSRSSSATDSNNADGHEDEGSVNQDPSAEQTGDNGVNQALNAWKKNKVVVSEPACPNGGADVIVLSSSDEESDYPTASLPAKEPASHRDFYANGSALQRQSTDAADAAGQSTFWPQEPTYRFLGGADEPCPTSPDYTKDAMDDYGQYLDEGAEEDPAALRLFLPPQPARATPMVQDPVPTRSQDEEPDGWFSLSLGSCDKLNQDPVTLGMRNADAAYHELSTRGSLANTVLGLNNSSPARTLQAAAEPAAAAATAAAPRYHHHHQRDHHHRHHRRQQQQQQRLHFRVQPGDSD